MNISNYIKSKIKGKSRKNKKHVDYIDDLMFMESFIRYGGGMGSGYRFHHLKSKYRKEHHAILKELFPKRLEEEKRREIKDKEEDERIKKRLEKEAIEQEKKDKRLWFKLGGKE